MKGSIRKREGKNGTSYQLVVELGIDPETGKRQQKRITFHGTRKEADSKLREILRALDTGTYVDPSKMTFGKYLDYWLEHYAKQNVTPRTLEGYTSIIKLHLKPALGRVPLQKLRPSHLQTYYSEALTSGRKDSKKKEGLSPTSVLQQHRIIREALKHGVRWQMIDRNVADAVEPPRIQKPELQTISEDQLSGLLESLRGTYLYLPALLAAMTGMRLGEVLGLRWQDVDLKTGAVHINQTLQQRKAGEPIFGEPKTDKSRRRLDLAPSTIQVLKDHSKEQKEWRLRAGGAWQGLDLVCSLEDGRPIHPPTVSSAFRKAAEANLDVPFRFHDLRHSAASLMLKAGVHPKVVADILGHSQISITLDRYSHVMPGLGKEAIRQLSIAVLGG